MFSLLKNLFYSERRNYGGADTLANTTTAAQRRDRRRELEEKYGIGSARAMAANKLRPQDPGKYNQLFYFV